MQLPALMQDPFDKFAAALSAPGTLRAAQALLVRLETKVSVTKKGSSLSVTVFPAMFLALKL